MRAAKRLGISFFVITIFAVTGIIFRYDIHDWVKLRGYEPNQEILALANDTSMLPYSRRLFFVNKPLVTDKQSFNSFCRHNEHSIVLGCYIPGQQGIYLLNVTDTRLNGVKEVTAAHEMLHAAYERLSSKERKDVDTMIQEAYKQITDARILDTIELYRKQDPSIVPNEMHSIFGTEIAVLPPDLEAYYGRYFQDRSKVVRFAEQYEQAFSERQNRVRELDSMLVALKSEIDAASQEISEEDNRLKNIRNQMTAYRSTGQTTEYNALVPEYNRYVALFNANIDELSAKIVRYNTLVQERNEVASEQAELVEAIDSREVLPTER